MKTFSRTWNNFFPKNFLKINLNETNDILEFKVIFLIQF